MKTTAFSSAFAFSTSTGTSASAASAAVGGKGALALILFAGGFDRVHYGLVLASAAAAISRPVTLFFAGRAVRAVLADRADGSPGWHGLDPADDGTSPAARDAGFASRGVGTFAELREACVGLGVRFMACEMAVRLLDGPPVGWSPGITVEPGGVVTFLNTLGPETTTLFV